MPFRPRIQEREWDKFVETAGGDTAIRIANSDGSALSSGGVSLVDDAAYTAGASSVNPVGGIVTADPVDSGDVGAFKMLANRQQVVTLYTEAGAELTTIAVTQSGTWDEVGINDSGNSITVDWAGTAPPIGAGLEATALRVTVATDSTGVLSIDDNGGNISIDDGGNTITVDGTVAVTNAGLTELAAAINASSQMDVNIAAAGATVPVSNAGITTIAGAVSGTEMQVDVLTSALPTGAATLAEQQTQTASLSVMDDWDETDRAKVNPIVGQAGIAGGAGTSSALTTRTVQAGAATGTTSSVADSATSVTLLASNANRRGASVYNDSTEILYAKCGATATTTDFTVKMFPQDYWECPANYSGILEGIWSANGSGSARVTEYS